MAVHVPRGVGFGVALHDTAPRVGGDVIHHGLEALHPFRPGVGDRLFDELAATDRQHHVGIDARTNRLLQHDEVGPGRGRGHDGYRSQRGQEMGHPVGNHRHFRVGESSRRPVREVDSVACMHQQHLGRVVPASRAG